MQYDYGNPKQGISFEYDVFGTLFGKVKNSEVELFDYKENMKKRGQKRMNALLVKKLRSLNRI